MIHKLHFIFQRLIVVEFFAKSVYNLTKQCQRIYENDFQIDKTKRIVNKINMQKQRKIRTFNVVVFFAFALTVIASALFFRQFLFESKSRLFNSLLNTAFRLTQKKL